MTTQHTPGPWESGLYNPLNIFGNGRSVAQAASAHATGAESDEIAQANARLIAAAPTMLATLQAVLESMGDYYDATDATGDEGGSLHDLVETTIHQATQS